MTWPQPSRNDHEKFCLMEGWTPVRDARGRTGTHHVIYELPLADGRILRTRVSHPVDRTNYGPNLWSHILRDQLTVTEAEFWTCVRDGVKPHRGGSQPPPDALPAELVNLLVNRVRLDEASVAKMTKAEAIERLNRYWSEGS